MGLCEEDLEMGVFFGGVFENQDWKFVKSNEEVLSDMKLNILDDNGGGDDIFIVDGVLLKVVGLNLRQFCLWRVVLDVCFKVKLVFVFFGKKVCLLVYFSLQILEVIMF